MASRATSGCLSSSLIPLLLYEASLSVLRVTPTHFALSSYERALCLPTSFPISGLARHGVKPRPCRVFAPTHPLMLPSITPREALVACPPSPPGNLPSFTVEFIFSSPCSRSNLLLSRQDAALAHLDSLPPFDLLLLTDGFVSFSFGKSSTGVKPTALSVATISFSTDPVCSSFSAEACTILEALFWSRQHQQVCHFSSLLLILATLSFPQSFRLPQTLWQKLSSLSCTIRL